MASLSSGRRPSARETAISTGVVCVLVVIAAWLWSAQAHFSPAVTVAASVAQAAEAARSSAAAQSVLVATLPAGLRAMSPVESFSPDTLSDKIDGKAELYLSAGFLAMRCQRFAPATAPTAWFEAFIYDMGRPENAFSVYSSQKRTAAQDAGVGDYSYLAGNQLCLVHGQYYLEFVGADDREPTLQAAGELARAFVSATTVARHANVAKDEALFPTEGMIAGSLMLLSADVFGFDQLKNVYVARYREGKDDLTLFLSRRASPSAAGQLAAALRGFFVTDCGGKETAPPLAPVDAVIIDSGGAFDGVFVSGALLAGVHQAPSRAVAERWMQRLDQCLRSATP
jgi:hypothetical protein